MPHLTDFFIKLNFLTVEISLGFEPKPFESNLQPPLEPPELQSKLFNLATPKLVKLSKFLDFLE